MITVTISILIILLLFLTGIFFIPLKLVINTKSNQYYLNLPGYFRIDVLFGITQQPKIKVRLFFFTFRIEPFKRSKNQTEKSEINIKNKRTKKGKRKTNISSQIALVRNCFQQFEINKLDADIDTGDFPLNAQLIPIAHQINNQNINLNVNFNNQNNLEMVTTTQIFRFIKPLIKFKMSNK